MVLADEFKEEFSDEYMEKIVILRPAYYDPW